MYRSRASSGPSTLGMIMVLESRPNFDPKTDVVARAERRLYEEGTSEEV